MKISVIHATRAGLDPISSRHPRSSDKALNAHQSRLKSSSGKYEIEYIFGVDEDDPVSIDMAQKCDTARHVICTKQSKWGPRLCDIHAQNEAAEISTGEILIQGSDDVLFPKNWDEIIFNQLGEATGGDWSIPKVLGVGDPHFDGGEYSGDGMLGTFIMTRGVYNIQGYFCYPEYDGMHGDTDFTAKAALEGWLIDAYDSVYFRHFWHGGMDDKERDAIHDRHMSKEAHEIGYSVLTARFYAGLPNIELMEGCPIDKNLADRDLREGRFSPSGIFECNIENALNERLYSERLRRGFYHLGNKPHREGSIQWHFLKSNWKEVQELSNELIHKYHFAWCGGRFRFAYGFWLWNEAARNLNMSPRADEYDRLKMSWIK